MKKHDQPLTPLQRLLASPDVTPDVKRQLKDHLSTLDPFLLQQQISTKIKKILRLATPLQKITVANLPQNTYHPA